MSLDTGEEWRFVVGSDEVAVYRPKESPTKMKIQAYVSAGFKARVMSLARLWSMLDRANEETRRTADKPSSDLKGWSESDVVKRLLEVAMDAAWAEVEGGEPQSEVEWTRLEAALLKRVKQSQK